MISATNDALSRIQEQLEDTLARERDQETMQHCLNTFVLVGVVLV